MNWDEKSINLLISLYGTRPVKEIAEILGTTKNAVIGKANRMGLSKPKGEHGVRFENLKSKQCRWPKDSSKNKGSLLWCGLPVKDGCSYCEKHLEQAYVKESSLNDLGRLWRRRRQRN